MFVSSIWSLHRNQYNGKIGRVCADFNRESGRYRVELLGNKKSLAVRPINLQVVCTKCLQTVGEAVAHHSCERCSLPYCSDACRQADWNNKHKANCIPTDLPDVPESVGDADAGDEAYEASLRYMNLAVEAGNEGRYAEEHCMLQALIQKDNRQPAAYFNLFRHYANNEQKIDDGIGTAASDSRQTTAFAHLQRCVALLSDGLVGPSVTPPTQSHTMDFFYESVLNQGLDFLASYIRGRNELQQEADVVRNMLVTLSEADALEEKKEKIEQSVQQARSVLALVVARNDELQQQLAYRAQLLLAKMLCNQTQLGFCGLDHREKEENYKAIHDLAKAAVGDATRRRDLGRAALAEGMLKNHNIAKYNVLS